MTYASGTTYWEAFAPGLIVLLLSFVFLPWFDRDSRIHRGLAVAVCLALSWRYIVWRVTYTLPPVGVTLDFSVGLIFLTVEFLALIGGTAALVFLTGTRSRSADADQNLRWLVSLPALPKIDVLICTYNEDEKILDRTIIGALALDYPNYRLWVCDDGRRPQLRTLCEEHGCGYITRPDNAHAKAGNINNALKQLGALPDPPDFIAILDADFVPKPAFLTRTLALMRDKDVGIVQTPQHFFNPDPIQSNLSMARVWPDEQRYFFDTVMASKDAWDCAFCCGTSSLIRSAALMEIGGVPTDSVTEDYLLSLTLRENGYRTVYLNERLSIGLAPEGLKEYIDQRSRWALGLVQICRGPSGPLRFGNKLPLLDRIMLMEAFLHWSATYAFRLLGLIVPAIYLLFDIQAVYANVAEAISYFLPYFVAQTIVIAWISRGRVLPIMSDLSQLLCADAVLQSIASGFWSRKGHKFKVTAKGRSRYAVLVQWSLLRGFVLYLALTVAGILWAFVLDDARPLAESSGVAFFWGWYNIVVLILACLVAVETSDRRSYGRFKAAGTAVLTVNDKEERFSVADISLTGMRLLGHAPGPVGSPLHIHFENLDVEANVARIETQGFGVRFAITPKTRAHLIRHVYGGSYSASVETVRPIEVATAIVTRVFR
jgi:cellulose synthase (UDP-forming)